MYTGIDSIPSVTTAAVASGGLRCHRCRLFWVYYSPMPFTIRHLMPPKTHPTGRKRQRCNPDQAESTNLSKRILRAMRTIGVPETGPRVRYARLFMCLHVMRGVCRRWQAAWALHQIIKDWLMCPSEETASEAFLATIQSLEEEVANICYLGN